MIKTLLLSLSLSGIGFVSLAQYCVSGGPTSNVDSNVESIVLNGTTGSINYTGCPGVIGVEEVLAQSATLDAGSAYTITIQFGTCGGNYSGVGEAWIDYNLNGVFEASESLGTWQGAPPTAISNFNFTVPTGSVNGSTRLRVMQHEAGTLPLDPCASFAWGSVTDFTIVIQGGTGVPSASYCSGGPTSTIDSNVESVVLNGNSSSINFTGCPGVLGVQDVNQTADLGTGMNYVMDVQFGTCGGNYAGVGEAWIDFNANGTFEAIESIGTWQGTPPVAPSAFNFTVPLGAVQGPTKMRVVQHEAGTLPLDPCASYAWGSMMDFNIEIIPGIDCSGYSGDDQADAIPVTSLPYTDNHSNSICYSNQHPIYNSPDVYYKYVVQPGDIGIIASLCGSSFDTYMTVTDKYGNILNANDDYASCGTSSQCTVNVTGYDSVYVIVEGWGNLKGDYTLNITATDLVSLNELESVNSKIYPNPTSGVLNIEVSEKVDELTVIDPRGTVIFKGNFENQIEFADQPNGIYFLKLLYGDGKVETHKIIKR